jgi:hypothetical protein
VQQFQAQSRNMVTEWHLEKRAILPERHKSAPSEPGKPTGVLHGSCVKKHNSIAMAAKFTTSQAGWIGARLKGCDQNIAVNLNGVLR